MLDGFVVIDKPAGITSHDVVSRVRRILGTRKVGHTGTLDPFATGVLPIAVNDGTKVIPFLDEGLKCYEAVMRLGVRTDTLDMTGSVLAETDSSCIDTEQLQSAYNHFTGNILQIPPMYSAIKQGGQPLYKLARQGQEVERAARPVEIISLESLAYTSPLATFRVTCSRGTYVRTLADDIGRELGCGAALQELRRTCSGPFTIDRACTLDQLEQSVQQNCVEQLFVTNQMALEHLMDIALEPTGVEGLRFGRVPSWDATALKEPLQISEPTLVRLTSDGQLLAVAQLIPDNAGTVKIVLKRVFIAS